MLKIDPAAITCMGLPEKIEKNDLETWVVQEFVPEGLSPLFAFESTHWLPARAPPVEVPPRMIVAKLLHFRYCDLILRRARQNDNLMTEKHKVVIFPDSSQEVQRAAFGTVKKNLQDVGVAYSMQFPARLRVITPTEV
ncbi:hypothetical protein NDU88_002766 [Pleurodeles waltl]|uniref:Uncharacterized protein n=1 Tax=Pleurodeles waltl TaxID=8319 RepID=A0AAV7RGB0_PLEWA|nr:hypothetical protein NDU88_002766 [Pleurodeles waltl]